jgi:hypothetical protein
MKSLVHNPILREQVREHILSAFIFETEEEKTHAYNMISLEMVNMQYNTKGKLYYKNKPIRDYRKFIIEVIYPKIKQE